MQWFPIAKDYGFVHNLVETDHCYGVTELKMKMILCRSLSVTEKFVK